MQLDRIRTTTCAAVACVWMAFTPPLLAADSPVAVAMPPPLGSPPASSNSIHIARSALLTVEGSPEQDALELSVRRVKDGSPIGSENVSVTVDGKNEPVTRAGDGRYQIPVNDLRGDTPRDVEIIVAHDGIKEILSGKVAVTQTGSATGLLGDHKQIAWWILNIVIVLIAAIAISRRKG